MLSASLPAACQSRLHRVALPDCQAITGQSQILGAHLSKGSTETAIERAISDVTRLHFAGLGRAVVCFLEASSKEKGRPGGAYALQLVGLASRPGWGLALTPTCRSLQLELIISQSVGEGPKQFPESSVSLDRALGPWSSFSLCNPTPSLTLGQASKQGSPIDATFSDLVETGNHPCAAIPSAPTGQRCCCYSRPGYKALSHHPPSTLVSRPAT